MHTFGVYLVHALAVNTHTHTHTHTHTPFAPRSSRVPTTRATAARAPPPSSAPPAARRSATALQTARGRARPRPFAAVFFFCG